MSISSNNELHEMCEEINQIICITNFEIKKKKKKERKKATELLNHSHGLEFRSRDVLLGFLSNVL